eukprot:CAMPEP_0183381506 /NCGR_PEP_ID=MMETSP0164_2-20130417/126476_1 /TAXON_ID=221442 /ORGANISM="Coccolithus pelagicus ssp braarudi, Strain PLY182g" /LENGTH=74 /DNA_ID=CAMNT_0025559117 /DNA_START=344 /DNA_END=568 /DNA_ORIENTATION=+
MSGLDAKPLIISSMQRARPRKPPAHTDGGGSTVGTQTAADTGNIYRRASNWQVRDISGGRDPLEPDPRAQVELS